MNLFENPFLVLGVSTRDNNQQIIEAFDVRSLSKEPEVCRNARTMLTHPKNRIAAEIAWLPGVAPSRALDLITKIRSDPKFVFNASSGLEPLARCNLVASLLVFLNSRASLHSNLVVKSALYLAKGLDQIDVENLLRLINEDRQIAGSPLIPNVDSVEREIQQHFSFFTKTMLDCLNNVKDPDLVFMEIVEKATDGGTEQAPYFIDELADTYQTEVQKYLDQLSEKIRTISSDILKESEAEGKIYSYLDALEENLRAWDQIAQPIQLIMWSRGKEDEDSLSLAEDLRSLAISVANEYGLHNEAKRITDLMTEVFRELPQFSEVVAQDVSALEEIIEQKEQSAAEYEKWKEKISLDLKIGKDRLTITPECITYKNKSIKTADVTRVRWGIYKEYINLIRASREYTIWVGTPTDILSVECVKFVEAEESVRRRYFLILDKLWNAVCIRLLGETFHKLSTGEKVRFGGLVVDQNGVLLKKQKWTKQEPFYSRWEDLTISNGRGTFVIRSSKEKRAYAELPYRDVDNVHILESLMRFLWKNGNYAKLQRSEFS